MLRQRLRSHREASMHGGTVGTDPVAGQPQRGRRRAQPAAAVPILQVGKQKWHRCRALLGRLAALRQQGRLSASDLAVWQAWWCQNCKLFGPLTKPVLTGASAVAAWTAAVEVLRCDAISNRNSCAHSAIGVLPIFGWRWPDWLAAMLLWRLFIFASERALL